jgi:hypothetical protein
MTSETRTALRNNDAADGTGVGGRMIRYIVLLSVALAGCGGAPFEYGSVALANDVSPDGAVVGTVDPAPDAGHDEASTVTPKADASPVVDGVDAGAETPDSGGDRQVVDHAEASTPDARPEADAGTDGAADDAATDAADAGDGNLHSACLVNGVAIECVNGDEYGFMGSGYWEPCGLFSPHCPLVVGDPCISRAAGTGGTGRCL